MNDYVNDFYTACELVDDDLELLAQIMVLVRDKRDKTRPNIIEHYCDECKFDLLHKYTSKICDMPYRDFTHVKNKAKNKLLEKKQEQINLFDFYNVIIEYNETNN